MEGIIRNNGQICGGISKEYLRITRIRNAWKEWLEIRGIFRGLPASAWGQEDHRWLHDKWWVSVTVSFACTAATNMLMAAVNVKKEVKGYLVVLAGGQRAGYSSARHKPGHYLATMWFCHSNFCGNYFSWAFVCMLVSMCELFIIHSSLFIVHSSLQLWVVMIKLHHCRCSAAFNFF